MGFEFWVNEFEGWGFEGLVEGENGLCVFGV